MIRVVIETNINREAQPEPRCVPAGENWGRVGQRAIDRSGLAS
jgi:hypothetical protein